VKFLKIKLNAWLNDSCEVLVLLIWFFITYMFFYTKKASRGSSLAASDDIHRYALSLKFFYTRMTLTWLKFVFWVNVLNQRYELLIKSVEKITCSDTNFMATMRILTNLSRAAERIEKACGVQMLLFVCSVLCSFLYAGYQLAFNMAKGNFQVLHVVVLFMPITGVYVICRVCRRCEKNVSFKRFFLKKHKKFENKNKI
jgi:hypothetical protein